MDENELSRHIVAAAIEVHRTLGGPGLLESVYEEALVYEMLQRGMKVERQKSVPIIYKDIQLSTPLRLDILVEDLVIVECKATRDDHDIFAV
jgi:GxxExxY protein